MSKTVLPLFSFKSFIVCWLTLRSLIHFEFIFVYDVIECSNFTVSPVAGQFSQHYLLKKLPGLHCILLLIYYWLGDRGVISRIYVHLHWSIFPFLCQYQVDLITVALSYSLKTGSLFSMAEFFFLMMALSIWGLLCFCTSCNIFLLIFWKISLVVW